jgi:hypothetical protein
LVGERPQNASILAGQASTGQRKHGLLVQLDRIGRVLGPDRGGGASHRLHAPAVAVASQHGRRVQREGCTELLDELRERVVVVQEGAAKASQRLGFGPRPSRLRRPPSGQVDQRADHRGHGHKDQQGEHVGPLGDREVVQGWREVPVGEQEGPHRGRGRRPKPADSRHGHDEQQVEEQHAGQVDKLAQAGQDPGEQRQPDHRDQQAAGHAPPGEARHLPAGLEPRRRRPALSPLAPVQHRAQQISSLRSAPVPGVSIVGPQRRRRGKRMRDHARPSR